MPEVEILQEQDLGTDAFNLFLLLAASNLEIRKISVSCL